MTQNRTSPIMMGRVRFVAPVLALALWGCNDPPSAPSIRLTPSAPVTTDTLKVQIDSAMTDPDSRDIRRRVRWFRNGIHMSEYDNDMELPASITQRGDIWEVAVFGTDAAKDKSGELIYGPPDVASVEILNSAPALEATLFDGLPGTLDQLQVTVDNAVDLDGDRVQLRYEWSIKKLGDIVFTQLDGIDGNQYEGDRIPVDLYERGDVVRVEVTPFDDELDGATVALQKEIYNTDPTITDIDLGVYVDNDGELEFVTGQDITGDSTVHAQLTVFDPDVSLEPFTINGTESAATGISTATLTWYVNGVERAFGSEFNFSNPEGSAFFQRADVVNVGVRVADSHGGTTEYYDPESQVTIVNSVPYIEWPPESIFQNTEFVAPLDIALLTNDYIECAATGRDNDGGDEENLNISYRWQVEHANGVTDTYLDTQSLDSSLFVKGDIVTCGAIVDDGNLGISHDYTVYWNEPMTVGNTTPSVGALDVGSNLTGTATTFSLQLLRGSDPDYDDGVDLIEPYRAIEWWMYVDDPTVQDLLTTDCREESPLWPQIAAYEASLLTEEPLDPWWSDDFTEEPFLLCDFRWSEVPGVAAANNVNGWVEDISIANSENGFNDIDFRRNWQFAAVVSVVDIDENHVKPDGFTADVVMSQVFEITNNTPAVTALFPEPTYDTSMDLVVDLASANDIDGDVITQTVVWTINGVEVPAESGLTLDSSYTKKGDTIQATVSSTDGNGGLDQDVLSVTIGNYVPEVASVTIERVGDDGSGQIYVGDSVTCSAVDIFDADTLDTIPDSLTTTYEWNVLDGNSQPYTGSVLPGMDGGQNTFARGDSIWCTVTVNDGTDTTTRDSVIKTVLNTPPTLQDGSVSLSPTSPNEASNVTATVDVAGYSDEDGDDPTWKFEWFLNSDSTPVRTEITSSNTDTLPGTAYNKDDDIFARVTPQNVDSQTGDTVEGNSVDSPVVTAINTPPVPTLAVVQLGSGSVPTSNNTLAYSVDATDTDGDDVTWAVSWFIDGVEEVQLRNYETITSDLLRKGQDWYFVATPSDDDTSGASITSNTVTIVNSPPSVDSVSMTYDPSLTDGYFEGAEAICSWTGWTDVDGDLPQVRYEWFVNGTGVAGTDYGSPNPERLTSAQFDSGDTINCEVTPFDVEEDGSTLGSSSASILNTRPVLEDTVAIQLDGVVGRTAPREADLLTVFVDGSDVDPADSVSYQYKWFVDGAQVSTSATLSGAHFSSLQSVYVEVTPFDGSETGDPKTSPTLSVINTPPAVNSVDFASTDIRTADDTNVIIDASDDDGDAFTTNLEWRVNGTLVQSGTDTTLASSFFVKGDQIVVTAAATDTETGDSANTGTLTILNTAPESPVVARTGLVPSPVAGQDDIECTVEVDATDIDQDEGAADVVSYDWAWFINGVAQSETSSTLSSADYSAEDFIRCEATATDSEDTGGQDSIWVRANPVTDPGDDAAVDMIPLASGTFTMGSPAAELGRGSGESQHSVELTRPFEMGATEITQALWWNVMGYIPADYISPTANYSSINPATGFAYADDVVDCPDCPVGGISWHEAAWFTNELNDALDAAVTTPSGAYSTEFETCYTCTGATAATVSCTPDTDIYACEGYRLPTDGEWEYAARNGGEVATAYAMGRDLDAVPANTCDSATLTIPAGESAASLDAFAATCANSSEPVDATNYAAQHGFYGLAGNVAEWTHDQFPVSNFGNGVGTPTAANTDPNYVTSLPAVQHVLRGGSFDSSAGDARLADRGETAVPTSTDLGYGLRIVRTRALPSGETE